MLNQEDIRNIIEAQKEVFPAKEDFEAFKEEMRKDFSDLLTSVDAYAHKADTYFMEMAALGNKVDRLERWMNQLAEKVGIKLS